MTPYHHDNWLTVWQGDCVEVMAQMPAESVHTVVTSPPYWGGEVSRLRYLWHRIRLHEAYWHRWGSACNTCDKDFR